MKQSVLNQESVLKELLEISDKVLWTRLKEAENKKVATMKMGQITQVLLHEYVTEIGRASCRERV